MTYYCALEALYRIEGQNLLRCYCKIHFRQRPLTYQFARNGSEGSGNFVQILSN